MSRVSLAVFDRKPSVVCFQEVWHTDDADRISEMFEKRGFRRIDAGCNGKWLLGGLLCFFRARDWILQESAIFYEYHAHAPKIRIWEGDGLGRKGALMFNLKWQPTGSTLTFVNTHLQAQYGAGREYHEVRLQQIMELNAFASRIPQLRPAIVAGDFNTIPAERKHYLRMSTSWVDLTAEFRAECQKDPLAQCGTAWNEKNHHLQWIDYIWSRQSACCSVVGAVQLIRNEDIDAPYSDHEGLDANLMVQLTLSR